MFQITKSSTIDDKNYHDYYGIAYLYNEHFANIFSLRAFYYFR